MSWNNNILIDTATLVIDYYLGKNYRLMELFSDVGTSYLLLSEFKQINPFLYKIMDISFERTYIRKMLEATA